MVWKLPTAVAQRFENQLHQSSDRNSNPHRGSSVVQEEDTMLYPYPKYNDELDAEAHVRAFFTTWQANHVAQRLAPAT